MATETTFIQFAEGTAAPATPASTKWRVYAKTTGLFYVDDAGTETGPLGASGASLGAWTSYTPALTASSTNPTLGSSTLTGRYKALDSKTYAINIVLTIDTTGWNPGSGDWSFSLPAGVTSAAYRQTIACSISDAGTRRYAATGVIGASATIIGATAVGDATGTATLAHIVPVTWATGDYVLFSGIIEVA